MISKEDAEKILLLFDPDHRTKREAAIAKGFCGSCCDLDRWNVRATCISVPPLDHVYKYNAKKEKMCLSCAAEREKHGWGYKTLRILSK